MHVRHASFQQRIATRTRALAQVPAGGSVNTDSKESRTSARLCLQDTGWSAALTVSERLWGYS